MRSEQRTLRLVAADETEGRAWVRVLYRCVEEVSQSEVSERAETLQISRSGARGMPQKVADVDALLDLVLPAADAPAAAATGGDAHAAPTSGGSAHGSAEEASTTLSTARRLSDARRLSIDHGMPNPSGAYPSLSAAQEEVLSVVLLTIHTYERRRPSHMA